MLSFHFVLLVGCFIKETPNVFQPPDFLKSKTTGNVCFNSKHDTFFPFIPTAFVLKWKKKQFICTTEEPLNEGEGLDFFFHDLVQAALSI